MAKKRKPAATVDEVKQSVLAGIVEAIDERSSRAAHDLAEVYLMLNGVLPSGYTANAIGFVGPPEESEWEYRG